LEGDVFGFGRNKSEFEQDVQSPSVNRTDGPDAAILAKALSGDSVAEASLALIYLLGLGVPQDHEQAAAWFRKAAD
jgi:TPR repeat protein